MKKIMNKIKDSKGFVSLEVIMIAGALILLGAWILSFFNIEAGVIANGAVDQLTKANEKMNGDTP
jgi:hypothetical protein